MEIVIAACLEDIPKIQNSFSNFTRIKGTFPTIKNCYDIVNSYKYVYDNVTLTGGENDEYPYNVIHEIKRLSREYDIVIIPIDNKLLKAIRKYKKIKRLFIYEEDIDSSESSPYLKEMMDEYLEDVFK